MNDLPVNHRITYKLCLITWKALHTTQPPCLSELIAHYLSSMSDTNLLARPYGITSNFSSLAFSLLSHLPGTLIEHIRRIEKLSNLHTPTKIYFIPVCFCRLVTLCWRLRFVLWFQATCKYVCMYVYVCMTRCLCHPVHVLTANETDRDDQPQQSWHSTPTDRHLVNSNRRRWRHDDNDRCPTHGLSVSRMLRPSDAGAPLSELLPPSVIAV